MNEKFTKASKEGPTFVRVICNRCFYARTAFLYDPEKYDINLPGMLAPAKNATYVRLATIA